MRAEPRSPRYSVEQTESFVRITIHAQRRIVQLLILGLLECAWWAFFVVMITWGPAPMVFLVWGALLSIVGLLHSTYQMAWELAGRETIAVTSDALMQSRSIGSFVRTRRYALAGVTRLRIPLEHGSWWAEIDANPQQGPRGIIQFDYRGRRKRLGIGLHVPEAQAILALLESRVARSWRNIVFTTRRRKCSSARVSQLSGSTRAPSLGAQARPWRSRVTGTSRRRIGGRRSSGSSGESSPAATLSAPSFQASSSRPVVPSLCCTR